MNSIMFSSNHTTLPGSCWVRPEGLGNCVGFWLRLQPFILYSSLPMSNTRKEDTSAATKADIADLRQIIVKRFDEIDKRFNDVDKHFERIENQLSVHDRQFEVVLEMLSSLQKSSEKIRRDITAITEQLLDNHERRLLACERRIGLAV